MGGENKEVSLGQFINMGRAGHFKVLINKKPSSLLLLLPLPSPTASLLLQMSIIQPKKWRFSHSSAVLLRFTMK